MHTKASNADSVRIAPLSPATLSDEDRARLEQACDLMGFLPNDALTMARVPGLLEATSALVGSAYAPGRAGLRVKRLVAVMVSTAAGCRYCQAHTRHGALRQGLAVEDLDELWDFETSSRFSEAERAALQVARLAALTPNAVTDEDFSRLRAQFSEDEAAELVAVIALFGFLNRWNDTVNTQLEAAPAAVGALP